MIGARLALLVLAGIAAVAWPLLTYTLTLAAFGVVHVLCELRYVDLRFGARVERRLRAALLVAVGAIAIGRIARVAGLLPPKIGDVVELAIGVGLVVLVLPVLVRAGQRVLALAIGGALAIGAAVSPVHAILALAVLHNLTPVGFVAEARARRSRAAPAAGSCVRGDRAARVYPAAARSTPAATRTGPSSPLVDAVVSSTSAIDRSPSKNVHVRVIASAPVITTILTRASETVRKLCRIV